MGDATKRRDRFEEIRLGLNVSPDTFDQMTIREVIEAQAREAWCGRHGAHRVATCEICRAMRARGQ